jgi:hypothetical protein
MTVQAAENTAITPEQYWVNLARDAHAGSSTWFDTNVRDRVINDIRQFQGEHPTGSKYATDSYRLKSKMFRPKTRTAIMKKEATAAEEYFATEDVVAIRPCDEDDPEEVTAAKFHKGLLQYRLTRPHPAGIPWFLTLMGGVQDALSVGVVCSFQDWKLNAAKGLDRPDITLLPVENYRFDPAADWRDVVNSSPYFIIKWPMYLKDVRAKMQKPEEAKTEEVEPVEGEETSQDALQGEVTEAPKVKPWRYYADGQIKSAAMTADTIRMAREKGTDSKDAGTLSEFAIAWVHENFIEVDGIDVVFYTLGTEHLLSDPVAVTGKYPQGRPVVVGFSIVEAHKAYKPSIATITKEIQAEVNDVANLRMDNVKLRLRPRSIVKRGAQVDLRALTRGVPGSAILANDVNSDIKFVTTDDATSSSYQEQDRLNGDFDDMAGAFSGASVASNRRLNETVGGMDMLNNNSDKISAYQLKTITETWVEPVLRQVIIMEQHYETDPVVLRYAAKQAGIEIPVGATIQDIGQIISDEFIKKDTILNVGVGTGSTNPQKKVERFSYGVKTLAAIFGPAFAESANQEEIAKEMWGALGYKDGSRFTKQVDESQDPEKAQMVQMIEQLKSALAAKNPPEVVAAQVAKLEAETRKLDVDAIAQRVAALFASMNTAQTAVMVPGVMPVADAIAKSAGFEDMDAAPIYPDGVAPMEIPADAQIPPNTSPGFPAQADSGMMTGIEGGM